MTIKHLFLAALAFLLFSSFSALNSDIVYVSIEGLNTSNYKAIKLACSNQEEIKIESACVPAEVIKVKYTGSSSDATNQIKSFFLQNGNFQSVDILENFTEDNYFEKCSDARVGR